MSIAAGGGTMLGMASCFFAPRAPENDRNYEGDEEQCAAAGEPREIGEAEEGDQRQDGDPEEMFAGALVFMGAAQAHTCLLPGGFAQEHAPVGVLEEHFEEAEHVSVHGRASQFVAFAGFKDKGGVPGNLFENSWCVGRIFCI